MRKNDIIRIFLALIMSITVLILLIKIIENRKVNTTKQNKYILKAIDGTVSLYYGEDIIETYDIEFETLPYKDKQLLISGIEYNNKDEVLSAIEDYDG